MAPFFKLCYYPDIAQILIELNNKNPESDTVINAGRSEKQSSQTLVLTSTQSSDRVGDPVARNPQTE